MPYMMPLNSIVWLAQRDYDDFSRLASCFFSWVKKSCPLGMRCGMLPACVLVLYASAAAAALTHTS